MTDRWIGYFDPARARGRPAWCDPKAPGVNAALPPAVMRALRKEANAAKETPAEAAGNAKATASKATAGFALAYRSAYSSHCLASTFCIKPLAPAFVIVSAAPPHTGLRSRQGSSAWQLFVGAHPAERDHTR